MGLGAGDLEQLPYGIYKKLKQAKKCYTRTMDHPVIDELEQEGVVFESFDHVYEKYDTFAEVYEEISETIMEYAASGDVPSGRPG
jgi:tetrapyrrole methylase family protein/MazG family protein